MGRLNVDLPIILHGLESVFHQINQDLLKASLITFENWLALDQCLILELCDTVVSPAQLFKHLVVDGSLLVSSLVHKDVFDVV